MRVVHIADPHLGYRAYNRVTPAGINVREADVFTAFRRALERVTTIEPDLILIAGDLFHVVRPSNLTIQRTFLELVNLRKRVQAPIVIIGGNHDSPRSVDTGCILDLYANLPGIYVAHTEYVQVPLRDLDTSVFCLCHRALPYLSSIRIEPDPSSRYNILLAHGTVEGVARQSYDEYQIKPSQVISEDWDYVAFGHYHVFEQLAANAYYAGSLEYTSTNIWSETSHPKGFIEYDLENRRLLHFHEIETRSVIDLRPLDAKDLTAQELSQAIEQRVSAVRGGHLNKIIRLIVENVSRSVQADLDYTMIRRIRSEALHFELQLRPPQTSYRASLSRGPGPARPLEAEWEEFARDYPVAPGIDRDHLIQLGRDYLARLITSE
jgi:DNA repair exonuclease SbcCD nuclease subunit